MIVDLFAGPGGWDTGLALLGRTDVVGVEWDKAACDTARAAGHVRVQSDVAELDPQTVPWIDGHVDGLIASPPCQAWSRAGKQQGILDQPRIFDILDGTLDYLRAHDGAATRGDEALLAAQLDDVAETHDAEWHDERSRLVLEPVRWALALRPNWIACEQVPDVLPFWHRFAAMLRELGYSATAGLLSSERYGVPQTRKRAILVASRVRPATLPPATHHAFDPRDEGDDDTMPGLFDLTDLGLLPWVSMAQALGWGMTARPYPTVASGRETGGPDKEKVGGSQARAAIYAEQSAGRWVLEPGGVGTAERVGTRPRTLDEPSPTITAAKGSAYFATDEARVGEWATVSTGANSMVTGRTGSRAGDGDVRPYERGIDNPAPTVDTKAARAWQIGDPGHRADTDPDSPAAVRVTVEQAACLQSFPIGYPWQGTKTAKFRQVGDAVPPLLAVAVLGNLLDIPTWRDICREAYR